jgi:hypothetical protein
MMDHGTGSLLLFRPLKFIILHHLIAYNDSSAARRQGAKFLRSLQVELELGMTSR